jgi:hypothetical protein
VASSTILGIVEEATNAGATIAGSIAGGAR